MMDVYVISGFSGAGKTALIKTMVCSMFRNKKIAVIEDDFGEAGIDAGLPEECSLVVTGLSDGCIYCSPAGDFEKAVERILEDYAPDAVLVEPPGVNRLSDITKICLKQEDRGLIHLKKTITVVDTRPFDKYRKNYGKFFENRVIYADLILLSCQEEDVREIQPVKAKLRRLDPEARIEADFWESTPTSVLRCGPRSSGIFRLETETAVPVKPVRTCSPREPSGKAGPIRRYLAREVFSSVTIEWKGPITEEPLRKRVLRVVEHIEGEILRGRGIMTGGRRGLVFHYLPGSLSIEPVNIVGNQVCFIGIGLDEQQIRTLFREETT